MGLWLMNVRPALAEPAGPSVGSSACDIGPGARKQQIMVSKRIIGDILAIGEGGNPAVLKGARALLICRGWKADKDLRVQGISYI